MKKLKPGAIDIESLFERFLQECKEREAEVIKEALYVIESYKGMLVGGWAIALYSKGIRKPTPQDIDFKVLSSQVKPLTEELKGHGFRLLRSNGWLIFEKDGQHVDIGLVESGWEKKALKSSLVFELSRLKVKLRVIAPEYLVVSKLFAGRGKDYLDVTFLIKSGSLNLEKAKELINKNMYLLDYLEEFKSLVLLAENLREDKIRLLF
ncbi:MAG: DUF6036 family nucleotidyltransferase [Hydrogenobacter sp.]|uniref:DUF6036 family nucleotidyltransferase n=1 Tax=Hydrogenobacter thermophilus TaxID=940 RepID=UPI0030FC4D36